MNTTAEAPPPGPLTTIWRRARRIPAWIWILAVGANVYALVTSLILSGTPESRYHFRFDISPLLESSLAVQVHTDAALGAFLVGLVILLKPKGVGMHRTLGWIWVVLMGVTAASSLFVTGLNGNSYSPLHALSAWTLIALPMGIAAIRRRHVKAHAGTMTGIFLGGLAIAGLFTFMPGRLMWSLFFAA